MEIGLLVPRLTVVLMVAAHGLHKLLGLFGGTALDGTAQFFAILGFPSGRRRDLMAGLAESGAGLLVALGLVTQVGAAAIISVMLVAVYTVHIKKGVFGRNGYEYNFVLSAVALTLAFAGPGLLSVDAPLGCKRSGPLWGVAALGLGVLGAMVTLFPRKTAPTV